MDVDSQATARALLKTEVDNDAIDDAAHRAGWQLVNIIPGDNKHPRQLLYSVFEGGWLYLVDDARFLQRWFQAEGARQAENLSLVRELLACEVAGCGPALRQADAGPAARVAQEAQADHADAQPADSSAAPMPRLPRLADHVLPRQHEMDGVARLLLHDSVRGDALELSREQFEIVALAQGTRDLEGVMLEASRHGWLRRRSSVRDLFELLHQRNELAGGIPGEQRAARHPERPIQLMPGLRLGCDGNGSCCRTYSSVLFSRDEAAQALSHSPTSRGRVFLPAFGADDRVQAVSTRDGACLFLDSAQRCVLHAAQLKPRGCSQYPLTFVDDGEAIHVTPVFECSCVQRSLLGELPATAPDVGDREGALAEDQPITRLPEQVRFSSERSVSRSELRGWTHAALRDLSDCNAGDAPRWLWSRRRARSSLPHGNAAGATAQPVEAQAPPLSALAVHIQQLSAHFTQRSSATAWRSEADRTRRLVGWAQRAAKTLEDPANVAYLMGDSWPSTAERRRHAEAELAYLRCVLFGYQMVLGSADVETALSERCVRMLLGRAMLEEVPAGCAEDTSLNAPLTALEALLRSQALSEQVALPAPHGVHPAASGETASSP